MSKYSHQLVSDKFVLRNSVGTRSQVLGVFKTSNFAVMSFIYLGISFLRYWYNLICILLDRWEDWMFIWSLIIFTWLHKKRGWAEYLAHMVQMRNRNFSRKPKGKSSLGIFWLWWMENIKLDLRGQDARVWTGLNWTSFEQGEVFLEW
jgi:hypothetical protein